MTDRTCGSRRGRGDGGWLPRRFTRDRRGTVAVEWAAVAVPFFAILGAIIDICLTGWVAQNLDNALGDAARTLQTGQFQKTNPSTLDTTELMTRFKKKICDPDGVHLLFVKCENVKVQVQTYGTIGDGQTDSKNNDPLDTSTKDWSKDFGTKYTNPGASSIVVVQAAVKYPVVMNILKVTPTFADGSRLIQSTVVFRTEPYQ